MSTARVVMHTVVSGHELITMVLKMPKFLVGEFNTHRSYSRNSASSRAIPHKKFRDRVVQDPVNLRFMKHQKGMEANTPVSVQTQADAERVWDEARKNALAAHQAFERLGVSKGQANRVLEPFFNTEVVATNTRRGWEAFFALRADEGAQYEIQVVAKDAQKALSESEGKVRSIHAPFVEEADLVNRENFTRAIITSVVNCARVSYLNHEGKVDLIERYAVRFMELLKARPIHGSPFEHVAAFTEFQEDGEHFGGNLNTFGDNHWIQLRKVIEERRGELSLVSTYFPGFDLSALEKLTASKK